MGMSYEQFWYGEPDAATQYRKAHEIRRRRTNEELWLSGTYMADALRATVINMFAKSKYEYPSEPKPLSLAELEEREEQKKKAKAESMKARFMAKALSINTKLGGKAND
jgi:hypothetical protein